MFAASAISALTSVASNMFSASCKTVLTVSEHEHVFDTYILSMHNFASRDAGPGLDQAELSIVDMTSNCEANQDPALCSHVEQLWTNY